jgi:tetratricopeptide (TPR) repeat protein
MERNVYSAFNIMGNNVKIDPKKTFGLKDSISSLFCVNKGSYNQPFQVELEVESQDESRPYFKKYLFEFPEGKNFWCFSKGLEDLKYANYTLKAIVKDEKGIILEVKSKDFQVSPLSYVPHPPLASNILKNENRFLFFLNIATQYQRIKEFVKAETYYEKAFQLNKTTAGLIKNYASFLLNQKKYDKMLEIIENLKGQEKDDFYYYSFKGKALYYKQDYNAAVNTLLKANKIYDSDISVLNGLGLALIRLGNKEEAVKALSASLKINEQQKDISEILEQLENKKNGNKNEKRK